MISGTLQPTSSGNYCPNYQPCKTGKGFAHQHCRALQMHQHFVCLILAAAAWPSQHFPGFIHHTRGSALPVLDSLVVQLCAVVVSELFFTSKTGLGLPKLQTSVFKLKYRNVLHCFLYTRCHPYSGPRGKGFPFFTTAWGTDTKLDLLLCTMFLLSGQN